MKKTTLLVALLFAGEISTPFALAQDLVVDGGTTNLTSGTNAFRDTFVGQITSDNQLNVSGIGTVLSNTGLFYVGELGSSNTLTLGSGAAAYAFYMTAGRTIGSVNNQVTVGSNATVTVTDKFDIGFDGSSNSLVITDGGDVSMGTGGSSIGSFSANGNSVLVTGSGSTLSNVGIFYVGFQGAGNLLTLSNQGQLTSDELAVGGSVGGGLFGSNNAILITGNGSMNILRELSVGREGASNSMVVSGGTVAVGSNSSIGFAGTSSNNSVLLTGTGSTWTNSGVIRVGNSGSGNSLVISNGGLLAAAGGVTNSIGFASTSSNNSVLVTGTGSTWTNGGVIRVGDSGSGNSLVISNGGGFATAAPVTIGSAAASSNNIALVTGAGSTWTNNGNLNVGANGSGNSLVISDGGSVAGGSSILGAAPTGSNNSVLVTGSGSILTVSGLNLRVGNAGSGNSLVISNGGTVAVSTNGVIGFASISSNNSVLVTGAGSTWTNGDSLTVGAGGVSSTLTVADGGIVAASSVVIASSNGSSGTLNIGRFGTNDAAGTLAAPTIAFGAGTGAINFNQSNTVTITSVISGNGAVNQLGSGRTILTGTNTYSGATTVSGGSLVVDGSADNSTVTVNNGGTLAGSGSVGGIVLNLGSTISPGNSPGTIGVDGNAIWNPGANYNWQIHDATPGGAGSPLGWDLINVTGSLDLTALSVGSEFNINLWSLQSVGPDVSGNAINFDNAQSYTWTILTATGGITGYTGTGQFSVNVGAFNGTGGFANALQSEWGFSVVQDGNNLNLVYGANTPIPEPGTWAAAALLAGGAAFMRWRKRKKVA